MRYDLFISYSREDNHNGRVAGLKTHIEFSFRAFAGRDLRVFFDSHEIKGMDDWRQTVQDGLREAHLFLAVLSPNYLASRYCRWEWEDYVRYEAMRQCLGEGVAPVYFVTLPEAATLNADQTIASWIREIRRRQRFDLRPWHDLGEQALLEAHVNAALEQLNASVRDRLDRAERASHSPHNLLRHNPAFVGRVRELSALRAALSKNKISVVGAHGGQVLGQATVQGLGGMGKTELALAYAHAFAWDYPGGRWWVRCDYVNDLRVALMRTNPLGIEFSEEEEKNIDRGFERVLRELARRERCLIILDNVNEPDLLQPEYLDRLPRDGSVDIMATTRLAPTSIPGSAQDQTFISVDELPEEDALALMRSHQPSGCFAGPEEDAQAREIVRLLRGFTLAIETAAIYLGRHSGPRTCRQFRERLSPDLLRESEQAAKDPTVLIRHRVRSLEETLSLTLETLSTEARLLLSVASMLPADQIATTWLHVLSQEQLPPLAKKSVFERNLEVLLGLRLFQRTDPIGPDGQVLVVRMHRLIQELLERDAARDQLISRITELAIERAKALKESWIQPDNRWELEPLRAVALLWMDQGRKNGTLLANEFGFICCYLSRFRDGEEILRRALAIDEKALGLNHLAVAVRLNNLAHLLQATDRLVEAEPLMRRAIAIDEQHLEDKDIDIGAHVSNLGHFLLRTNRFEEAEGCFRRALALDENKYGKDAPDVATDIHNLADLLRQTNRLGEAEPLIRRALEIRERVHGPDHPELAVSLRILAVLLSSTNRMAEAEKLLKRALEIDENCFGPDHPDVATDLKNLAGLLLETNRAKEAEVLARRAVAIFESWFGTDDPHVSAALFELAQALWATNQVSDVESLLRRAMAIDEKSYGSTHSEVGTDLTALGQFFEKSGRFREAEPLLRRALAIMETSFGKDHPRVASVLNILGLVLENSDRPAEAEPLLRRALQIDEASLGKDHPKVAVDLNNLGGLLRATRLGEAEALIRRAIAIDKLSPVPDYQEVATRLSNFAEILRAKGQIDEAERQYRHAIETRMQNQGTEHSALAAPLNGLANILERSGRLSNAEPVRWRVVELLLRFSYDVRHIHPQLQEAMTDYTQLLRQMGKTAEEIENHFSRLPRELQRQLSEWKRQALIK